MSRKSGLYLKIFAISLLQVLLMAAIVHASSHSETPWTGTWDTGFPAGSAAMHLTQNGNQVSGSYEKAGGRIQGTVTGSTLSGTWTQQGASGTFEFSLIPDGTAFKGTYDGNSRNYWNGKRIK